MKNYRELLQEEPVVRRLSLIQLISYFGAWFSNVAIYTLLLKMDVSAEIVGVVAMLHFVAGVIQAPFSGAVIDKVAPKKLMLVLIFVEIITTLGLLFVTSSAQLPLLYLLIFLKMAAASFYFTAEMSLLPKILQEGSKLQRANELHSIIWSFSYTLGMAVSGFVVYLFGVKVAFMLDALLFCLAFFLLYTLQIKVVIHKAQSHIFAMMRESILYIRQNPKVFYLMVLHAFVGLTAFDALVALMVEKYYAGFIATSLALGMMHASRAVGLVVGPLFLGKRVNNRRFVYLLLAQGVAVWLWAVVMHNFYFSLIASVAVGFFTTTLWSYSYTLLQKNTHEKYYGRVVAYNDMLFLSVGAATSFATGWFYEYGFSLQQITFVLGFGFIIGSLYYNYLYKKEKIEEINV